MHPILFQVTDGFFIGTYGLAIALGLLVASALAAWRGKARGVPPEAFYDLTFIAVISGFLGARVLFIITNFGEFLSDPVPYLLSRTGFVFLGGLMAAAACCSWYVIRRRLDFWTIADVMAPSIAVGHAFGRIGCHLSGCCYGGVCESPLGVRVPRVLMPMGELWPNAYGDQLAEGVLPPDALWSLPVWPVQLMESTSLAVLAGVLLLIATRGHRKGTIFGAYLAGYAVLRFGLEMLRGDELRGVYFGFLSTSQILSIALLGTGIVILATAKRRPPGIMPGTVPPPPAEPTADDSVKSRAAVRSRSRGGR